MRLTTYTDYSLRVLLHLAVYAQPLTTIAAIAASYGISEYHLMKVVHQLGVNGYIVTVRGHGGGTRLARAPQEINIGDVVRRMEPDFRMVACFGDTEPCVIAPACVLARVLDEALAAFLAVLDRYTLADLLERRAAIASLLRFPRLPARVPASGTERPRVQPKVAKTARKDSAPRRRRARR